MGTSGPAMLWSKLSHRSLCCPLVARSPDSLLRGLATGTGGEGEPIYELRTYSLVPSQVSNFLNLSKEKFHLRTGHSKLLGYWTVELGGLNQVTHIWEYESYSHRAGVRAKLAADPQWQKEYFQKILPWLQHQDNIGLESLVPPVASTATGGVYEMWLLEVGRGVEQAWRDQLLRIVRQLESKQKGVQLSGVFSSTFGPLQTGVVLWRHDLLDSAPALQRRLTDTEEGLAFLSKVVSKKSKILAPTPFSPWQ